VSIFKAEKVVHENRFLAFRNAEVRGSIPLCSTINQLRALLAVFISGATLAKLRWELGRAGRKYYGSALTCQRFGMRRLVAALKKVDVSRSK
jgi:hypothetical protein